MKGITTLYIDKELIKLAKEKGINISKLFEQFLLTELEINFKNYDELSEVEKLKKINSELNRKLVEKEAEIARLKKEIKKLKEFVEEVEL